MLNTAEARAAAEQAVSGWQPPRGSSLYTIHKDPPVESGDWLGFGLSTVDFPRILVPDTPPVWVNTRSGAVASLNSRPPGTLGPGPARGTTAAATTFQEVAEEPPTGAVLVALPADGQDLPGDEEKHCTLVWLGEGADTSAVGPAVDAWLASDAHAPFDNTVDGVATLGEDGARVWLLADQPMTDLHDSLAALEPVAALADAADQFPTYTPHVTIGYPAQGTEELDPDTEAAAADVAQISFDRVALWNGDDHSAIWTLPAAQEQTVPDQTPGPPQAASLRRYQTGPAPAAGPAPADIPAQGDPWYGILAPEGITSGDNRRFETDSLTWRDLPLPFRYQAADAEGHTGAVVVGRIDTIDRDGAMIRATGVWDTSDIAREAQRLVEERMLRGTSIEADDYVAELVDADGQPVDWEDLFFAEDDIGDIIEAATAARICGATLVAIPAFHQSYVANGVRDPSAPEPGQDEEGTPIAGEQTEFVSEKPWGQFTAADYTPEQWKSATLVHRDPAEGQDPLAKSLHSVPVYEPDGALNRAGCHAAASALAGGRGGVDAPAEKLAAAANTLIGLYTNQLDETPPDSLYQVAGREPPANTAEEQPAAARVLVASAAVEVTPAWYFADPHLTERTALTVDGDRVYGHLATWGECHIGRDGMCVTPPMSTNGYAYFRTGVVDTDQGPQYVGSLTMDTGHAALTLGHRPAAAHYDNTGTVVADITCGHDDIGIWFSGRLRDGLEPRQVRALKAAGAVSGDWRDVRGASELVAALVVNVPGFPVPRLTVAASGGRQTALVAAGMVVPTPAPPITAALTMDAVLAMIDRRDRRARLRRRIGRDAASRRATARRLVKGSD